MVNLVTHRESKEARQRAHKLIEEVRKHKKIDGHYKFFCKIIGSRKRRCIVKDDNGKLILRKLLTMALKYDIIYITQ